MNSCAFCQLGNCIAPLHSKIILVFYHGGPTGNGSILKDSSTAGGAGRIYDDIVKYAKSTGREVKGAIIAPAAISVFGVSTGKDFLQKYYEKGDQVIIYGYSYGGDNAVNLAEEADSLDIPVNTMIIVDSSDGPLWGSTVDTSIPDNVEMMVNFYQTSNSGRSSASQSVGSGSDSGSSNSPGSRGYPHSAEADNAVVNHDVTAPGVTHGNIQDKARDRIGALINTRIFLYGSQ